MQDSLHIGSHVRHIRQLREINQQLFAQLLNITQQKVSKLENRKNIPPDLLLRVARVLEVSVEVIKNFDVKAVLSFVADQKTEQVVYPVKDVIEYFKEELSKKDKLIEKLRSELEGFSLWQNKAAKKVNKLQ